MDRMKEDESGEAFICFVVTRCYASEVFDIAKKVLEELSPAIHGKIRECQEFRVRACIIGTKEIAHGTTERAYYPG